METDLSSTWVKKFRVLTLALIFSGALNIGLLASIIFFVLKDRQSSFSVLIPTSAEKKQETTNGEMMKGLAKLSFRELVSFLTNKDLVEEGYSKRDLAVAALVAFHHFNLEKAISAPPKQSRFLNLSADQKIEIFPGMSDDQFEAIIRYAYQEKWPLTSKGLFLVLRQMGNPIDESLEQAFLVTQEFYALQVLFQKTEAPQDPKVLLHLICEGTWDVLERFSSEQIQVLDLSVERRRRLLLSYLALHSPTAAQLLLATDFPFAIKRLEDKGILDLLALLKTKTEITERFCVELLRSPRTDAVWQASAARLYSYEGEEVPVSIDPKAALARFAPDLAPLPTAQTSMAPVAVPVVAPSAAPVAPPAASSPIRLHVVQEGDNLWKIARLYKIKVDDIVKMNELEKDRLLPGMTLRLPQGTGSEPPR